MTLEQALRILLDEIDIQKEIYTDNGDTELIEAMKIACGCICREMKNNVDKA